MLTVSAPPHINSGENLNVYMANTVVALLPAAAFCAIMQGAGTALLVLVSVFSCMTASAAYAALSARKPVFPDLSAAVTGLIFSLGAPVSMPLWLAAGGGFIAIIVGREIFGGLGTNPFNPALIGLILTRLMMPINAPSVISSGAEASFLTLAAGAAYLLLSGQMKLHAPAGFLVSSLLSAFLLTKFTGNARFFPLVDGNFMLGACFLVNDPVTTPITRRGKTVFGIICGFIAVFIDVFYSVLVANMLTPLLDETLKPGRFGKS